MAGSFQMTSTRLIFGSVQLVLVSDQPKKTHFWVACYSRVLMLDEWEVDSHNLNDRGDLNMALAEVDPGVMPKSHKTTWQKPPIWRDG